MANRFIFFVAGALALLFGHVDGADELFKPDHRLWTPQPDEVYLQEVSEKINTTSPVTSIALFKDKLFLVMQGSIHRLDDGAVIPMAQAPAEIRRLMVLQERLYALSESGLHQWDGAGWRRLSERPIIDLCLHRGALHAATEEAVYRCTQGTFVDIEPKGGYLSSDITVVMADGSQVLSDPVRLGPIQRIASYSGTLYVLRPGKLVLFDGRIVNENHIDWGELASPNTNDLLAVGSRLFIATDRGLSVLRGAAVTTIKGTDGLPVEETTCLTQGFDHDIWIGTTTGAVRMLKNGWHYFGPERWLPADHVHAIAVEGRTVAIATDGGVGLIRYEPYTLAKKAMYYERRLEAFGHKRLGFIHSLYRNKDTGEWIREISDNDGGHTAPYLTAMCYKYAVTGDEEARREAVHSFKAMVWLEQITQKKGFVARAIWSTTGDQDRMARQGSGGLPAKWYPSKDGKWYWKGDTSSDEIDAHFYAVSLFHDLVAQGEEKELAKQHLLRIADHIIANGWVLRDMDGQPTRWGRWDPDYLLRPYGYVARGLNGMQAQTYMLTALALSGGNKKYQDAFNQLMRWGYQNYTVRQKITFPPEDIAPWDDNLANFCYYTLFRYSRDTEQFPIYLRSLERTWELKRLEHVPWYNFTYGAVTGNDCEVERAVQHLREWSLDCIAHRYTNSHRDDLYPEPGYTNYGGGTRAMSPREISTGSYVMPYDGGSGENRMAAPTGFLRDYWMGRYHGFICAPAVQAAELISVPMQDAGSHGAKPYSGPPRPDIRLR